MTGKSQLYMWKGSTWNWIDTVVLSELIDQYWRNLSVGDWVIEAARWPDGTTSLIYN